MKDEIITGDCLEVMKGFATESVDLVVTDPPYFLINESGSGFMGKSWDSINTESAYMIVCQSKEFASFALRLFRLLRVESNTDEVRLAPPLVNMNLEGEAKLVSNSSVQSAGNQSNGTQVKSNPNSSFVQGLALTKVAVLDLLSGLSLSLIELSEFQNLKENALFVIPYLLLGKEPRSIAQGAVSKLPTEQPCEENTILLSSTDEARISAVTEAMIGLLSVKKSTNGMDGVVESVQSIAGRGRFKLITSFLTGREEPMRWIIWSLYALSATQTSNTTQKPSLTYSLLYQFHKNWSTEAIRILKSGSFAFVMAPPRSDILGMVILALRDSGFVVSFSSMTWAYASGFPKSENVAKNIRKAVDRIEGRVWSQFNTDLEFATTVEELYQRLQIEAGQSTNRNDSAQSPAHAPIKVGKLNASVRIVESTSSEVLRIQERRIYTALVSADTWHGQEESFVLTVGRQSEGQSHSFEILLTFVPVDVATWLREKTNLRTKVAEILKTWHGKKLSSIETAITAYYAEVVSDWKQTISSRFWNAPTSDLMSTTDEPSATTAIITKSIMECLTSNTDGILKDYFDSLAKPLNGSYAGEQPKPAVEIIIVAMKPLSEKTYVEQALKNQKGITWLHDALIPFQSDDDSTLRPIGSTPYQKAIAKHGAVVSSEHLGYHEVDSEYAGGNEKGRFPANLLVSDDVLNDGQERKTGDIRAGLYDDHRTNEIYGKYSAYDNEKYEGDSGSFSRYFSLDAWWTERIKNLPKEVQKTFPFLIVPKASKEERNEGLEGFEVEKVEALHGNMDGTLNKRTDSKPSMARNYHPTVKPIQLMSYLITLGSRENDLILDPFCGSGSTCIAARILSRRFMGIEINSEYAEIARARIKLHQEQMKLSEV